MCRRDNEINSQNFWKVMKELHRKNALGQFRDKQEKNKKKEESRLKCRKVVW